MGPLNYHHLRYFWTVARVGGVTEACRELHLTQPAVSAQIRTLEASIGQRLLVREGRRMTLTEAGQLVFRYADEIFRTGRELEETLRGRTSGQPMRFSVGISDALPKLLAYFLLEPALRIPGGVRLELHENKADALLGDLAAHSIDLLISDAPASGSLKVRAYNHLLGECGVTVFGARELAQAHRRGFPGSLTGAPVILPTANTTLRRSVDQWLRARRIHPMIVAEIEDSAVLKVFGQRGLGLFVAPTAVEREVRRQYQVEIVGRVPTIRERFYAISAERRVHHPAVLAIAESARRGLLAPAGAAKGRG